MSGNSGTVNGLQETPLLTKKMLKDVISRSKGLMGRNLRGISERSRRDLRVSLRSSEIKSQSSSGISGINLRTLPEIQRDFNSGLCVSAVTIPSALGRKIK